VLAPADAATAHPARGPSGHDADHEVRRVRPDGRIKWRRELVFLSETLSGELVGIAEHESAAHIVRFCRRDLGAIGRDGSFRCFAPPRARLRVAPEAAGDTGTDRE
jgi:hypothetical protein